MTQFLTTSTSPAVLAIVTTIHLAMLLLRKHRNPAGVRHDALLAPSVAFAATPWLFTSPIGIGIGLLLHTAWFGACEVLIPTTVESKPATAPAAAPPPRPNPPPAAEPTKPTGWVPVPVIAVLSETDDITTFRMVRPPGFDFSAGQFVTVRVNVDGKPVSRCYSLSSSPHSPGYLEISVKRQGLVSGTLHATVRPGSMLELRSPAGGFRYPEGDSRPITLLAGGIGITPLMSMLRHGAHADPNRPITLLYSVLNQRDIVFRDELRMLERRHPHLKVVVTTTRGPHGTEYLSGRIDRRMLAEQVAELANNIFLICGPGPMIEAMKSSLAELGVAEAQVRSEAFEAAIAAASKEPEPATVAAAEPVPAAAVAAAGGFQLQLVASGHTISANGGQTLLETCEAAGVDIPSACRAGVCGTCRTRVVNGAVRCESDLLDDADRSQGFTLPCVAWPEGDCALEA